MLLIPKLQLWHMQLCLANKHKVDAILTSDKSFCEGLTRLFDIDVMSLGEIG